MRRGAHSSIHNSSHRIDGARAFPSTQSIRSPRNPQCPNPSCDAMRYARFESLCGTAQRSAQSLVKYVRRRFVCARRAAASCAAARTSSHLIASHLSARAVAIPRAACQFSRRAALHCAHCLSRALSSASHKYAARAPVPSHCAPLRFRLAIARFYSAFPFRSVPFPSLMFHHYIAFHFEVLYSTSTRLFSLIVDSSASASA